MRVMIRMLVPLAHCVIIMHDIMNSSIMVIRLNCTFPEDFINPIKIEIRIIDDMKDVILARAYSAFVSMASYGMVFNAKNAQKTRANAAPVIHWNATLLVKKKMGVIQITNNVM